MEKVFLTKDDILQVQDLPVKEVFVKEWNGYVFMRTLTAKEKEDYEWYIYTQGKKTEKTGGVIEDARVRLVASCLVDAQGERMFSVEEFKVLAGKSSSAIESLFKVAQQMNGMEVEEADRVVQDLSKGQSESSTSS